MYAVVLAAMLTYGAAVTVVQRCFSLPDFEECVQWKIFKISLVSVVQFACNNYTMHSSPSAILNSYKMTKHSVCDQHSIINFEILYIQCAL